MSNNDISNNGVHRTGFSDDEGYSACRDPIHEQCVPVRMKWTKVINVSAMECYYLSNPVNENDKPLRR